MPGIATRNWPSRYPASFSSCDPFQAHGLMLRSWILIVHPRRRSRERGWAALRQICIREAHRGGTQFHDNRFAYRAGRLSRRDALPGRRLGRRRIALGAGVSFPRRASSPAERRAGAGLPASRSASTRASRPIGAHRAKPGCRRDSTGRGSANLAAAEVIWPAPQRSIEDAAASPTSIRPAWSCPS